MGPFGYAKMFLNRIVVFNFILKIVLLLVVGQFLIGFPGSSVLTDMMISIFRGTKRYGPIFRNFSLCTLAFLPNGILFPIVDTKLTPNRADIGCDPISLQYQESKLNNMLYLEGCISGCWSLSRDRH